MTKKQPELDFQESAKRKDAGLARVSENNADLLQEIRGIAYSLAIEHGTVTMDMVKAYLERKMYSPKAVPLNLWGAVFRGKDWSRTGFIQTARPSGHARIISQWRWKGAI